MQKNSASNCYQTKLDLITILESYLNYARKRVLSQKKKKKKQNILATNLTDTDTTNKNLNLFGVPTPR